MAKTKVVVVGAGAVGGYVGGRMAHAGEDVTLIDQWPEHVEYMRKNGLRLSGMTPEETVTVPLKPLHISDVQSLSKGPPIDVAFISCKSYDTEWVARMIAPYLGPHGFLVSMQNCINEERVANVVGWGKVMGVILSLIAVELYKPGHIRRTIPLGGARHTVFRVGEVHGRVTERAEEVARMLTGADSSKVTNNLWGERWSKLIINSMRNGLSAASGMGGNERDRNPVTLEIGIRLGAEAVRVAQGHGFVLESMMGMKPEVLGKADKDKAAFNEIHEVLKKQIETRSEEGRPSMGQDIQKGRRTETEYINGYVAAKGEEIGIPAPTHAKMNEVVLRVQRGEVQPGLDAVKGV